MEQTEIINDIKLGDCVQGIWDSGQTYDLAILDPPYNMNQAYAACDDNKREADYLNWLQCAVDVVYARLTPSGAMWLMLPDEWAAEMDVYCRKVNNLTRRNWVIWAFTFGQAATQSFTRSHLHLLYYVRNPNLFSFDSKAIAVPSARQVIYRDKRARSGGKMPDDTWALFKPQLETVIEIGSDVWLQSRVCGTFGERVAVSPNQIPIPIISRIVTACTQPGGWVLDPFLGTGTTAVVCKKLGRNFTGYDISEECIAAARARVATSGTEDAGQLKLF